MLKDLLAVLGGAGLLDLFDDAFDLLIRDEAALHAQRLALAERRVEHIALADQLFCAGGIQNDARLDLARDRERDARGDVRLHDAGDDVRGRTLRCNDQVHACGTRLLRDAADRVLDFLRRDHHQIGKLVDDDDDLRQHLILLGSRGLALFGSVTTGMSRCGMPL